MKISRRQFLGTTVIGAAVAACGGDDGGGTADAAGKNCATNGTTAMIADNHTPGHMLMVTVADVTAGVDKTYDIMGGADHTHSVTVTAANFTSLKNNPNGTVQVTTTSTFAHTHTITIGCM